VARALAEVARTEAPDLVLCGRQAADDDSAAVGPYLAALLGWPVASFVIGLEIGEGTATARRAIEGATEVVEMQLPAVVTTTKGLNEPRYPSLKGIMQAKKKPLEEREPALGDPRVTVQALELPPERPPGKIVGEGAGAVPELVRLLKEEAKVL
jgi:electron transfer flavoprotein beta subunit